LAKLVNILTTHTYLVVKQFVRNWCPVSSRPAFSVNSAGPVKAKFCCLVDTCTFGSTHDL